MDFRKRVTDGPTDRRTDRPSYRDARTHLKSGEGGEPIRIIPVDFLPEIVLKGSNMSHTLRKMRFKPLFKALSGENKKSEVNSGRKERKATFWA